METSTASQGNSSVKSDDSSPQNESGRGSPPPNCAICLGTCKNKSFTDSCLHQFCFKCLLTWSKVKAECPLCKQNFKSIIHNVRSNHQYEQYMVEQTHEDIERMDIDNFTTNVTRRFRYRTTLTLPRRDSVAIQQLLLQHYPMMADVLPAPTHRRRPSSYFRRTVYRHNLWARPLPDFTGRFRDCTPEFYRYNNSQMHRLMPWLNRELHYLLNENAGHISYVMTQIMDLLPRYHINSQEFREAVQRYFGDRTEHFLHELYCFASTPYDMAGYDRNVQYTTDSRISTMVNEVLSSSDTESSVDSDIVLVSRSMPAEAPPGPSRVPAPVYPQNFISEPAANNVIPIETISQSDSDDDSSEVMVIGYIKPPHARTPEVVDLLGSDSDVVIEDEPQPEQPQPTEVQENRPAPLVKLTLSQHDAQPAAESESEGSTYTPPLPLTRSHQWSDSSPTTESSTSSSKSQTTPNSSSNSSTLSYYSDSSSDSFNPLDRRSKKRNSKKSSSNTEKPKKKSKKNKSNTHKSKKVKTSSTQAKKTNNNNHRKSNSGKGVKTSKRTNSTTNAPSVLDQPGTSGTQSSSKSNRKRKIENKHVSRESKRLKSVVNVVNRYLRSSSSRESTQTSSSKLSTSNVSSNTNAITEESGATTSASANNLSDSSDSEYNLPLNLTVRILQSHK